MAKKKRPVGGLSSKEKLASKNPAARAEGQREISNLSPEKRQTAVAGAKELAGRKGYQGLAKQEQIRESTQKEKDFTSKAKKADTRYSQPVTPIQQAKPSFETASSLPAPVETQEAPITSVEQDLPSYKSEFVDEAGVLHKPKDATAEKVVAGTILAGGAAVAAVPAATALMTTSLASVTAAVDSFLSTAPHLLSRGTAQVASGRLAQATSYIAKAYPKPSVTTKGIRLMQAGLKKIGLKAAGKLAVALVVGSVSAIGTTVYLRAQVVDDSVDAMDGIKFALSAAHRDEQWEEAKVLGALINETQAKLDETKGFMDSINFVRMGKIKAESDLKILQSQARQTTALMKRAAKREQDTIARQKAQEERDQGFIDRAEEANERAKLYAGRNAGMTDEEKLKRAKLIMER